MGIMGPGCSGSMYALADGAEPHYRALARALCGQEALARAPWLRQDEEALHRADYDLRFRLVQCRLCGGPHCNIHHLATACPHHAMAAAALQLRVAAARLLRRIIRMTRAILEKNGQQPPTLDDDETAALAALATTAALPLGLETSFILYRLLLATPWTFRRAATEGSVAATPPGELAQQCYLARAVARHFMAVSVRHAQLRPLALHWVTFAERELRALAAIWRLADDALPFVMPAPPPGAADAAEEAAAQPLNEQG